MSIRISLVVGLIVAILVGVYLGPVRIVGRRSSEQTSIPRTQISPPEQLSLAEAANAPTRGLPPSLPEFIRQTNREAAAGFAGGILDLVAWRIYLNMEWQHRGDNEQLCPALHAAQVSLWQDDLLLEEGLLIPQLISTDGQPKDGERHALHVVEFPTLSTSEFEGATKVVVYFESDRKWSYALSLGPVKDGKRILSDKVGGLNPLRTIFRDPRRVLTAKVALRQIVEEEAQIKERPRSARRRRPRQLVRVETAAKSVGLTASVPSLAR